MADNLKGKRFEMTYEQIVHAIKKLQKNVATLFSNFISLDRRVSTLENPDPFGTISGGSTVGGTSYYNLLIDEDDFNSDSIYHAPTQQSAKSYVDNKVQTINNDISSINTDITNINNDISDINSDISSIDTRITDDELVISGIVDDISDLDVRVTTLEATGSGGTPQSVLTSRVDNNNEADYLMSASSQVSLYASGTDPWISNFSKGYGILGKEESIGSINTTQSPTEWNMAGLTNKYYLYVENDGDGNLTFGKTLFPPSYGQRWESSQEILIKGSGSGQDILCENGNPLSVGGNTTISSAQAKEGSTSIYFDGTTDWIDIPQIGYSKEHITLEAWVRTPARADYRVIFGSNYADCMQLRLRSSGLIQHYLSQDGTGWDIWSSAYSTNTIVNNTWHHYAFTYDGYYCRVFLDGIKQLETANTIFSPGGYLRIGMQEGTSYSWYGWMDLIRAHRGVCRYRENFTPPTDLTSSEMNWFDTSSMKMYKGNPSSGWAEAHRLFVGEVEVSSGTISNLVTYQNNGFYETDWHLIGLNQELTYTHKLGMPAENIEMTGWIKEGNRDYRQFDSSPKPALVGSHAMEYQVHPAGFHRNNMTIRTGTSSFYHGARSYDWMATNALFKMKIKRNF